MPAPLPGQSSAGATATALFPLTVHGVWNVDRQGNLRGRAGVPTPVKGSVVFGYVFSYAHLVGGLVTLNRGRKGLKRTGRGLEDGLGTTRA